MDKIARIRTEIERRKSLLTQHSKLTYDLILETFIKEYDDLLSFLDTLSEEPDKSLEEAAEEKYPVYWKSYPKDGIVRSESSYDTNKQCRDAFIAGAEWQEKQDLKWAGEIHKNGYNLCKEQLLKDAVGGEVYKFGEVAYVKERNNAELTKYLSQFNNGDKVRIVVLKEEEE
jgi:hypothetical protein